MTSTADLRRSTVTRVHRPRPPENGYDRARDLPRLVALWPHEIADCTAAGRIRVVKLLRRALREQRRRGLAGHWSYELARHAALWRAYRHEVAELGRAAAAIGAAVQPAGARVCAVPAVTAGFTRSRRASYRDPSSSPAASVPRRNSALPSGSRVATPTWPGTRLA